MNINIILQSSTLDIKCVSIPHVMQQFTSGFSEATRVLRSALLMEMKGNGRKAHMLFRHALSLCPQHPDLLNHYGEFVEKNNLILADYYYSQALIFSPGHEQARLNHLRVLPYMDQLDREHLKEVDRKKRKFAEIGYIFTDIEKSRFIYNCAAMEGNTIDLHQTNMIIEHGLMANGKSFTEHSEILGLDDAVMYIRNVNTITLETILEIHRRVLGRVDQIEAGRVRNTPVCVGNYHPPGPLELDKILKDFILWLNSHDIQHPIQYAALAHHKLVNIHPFADGNGRTARLLMNLILLRNGFPIVTIPVKERNVYFEYLQLANEGDERPFVRYT